MSKIKVLVVDDSSLMRKLISNMITEDSEIEVQDTAMNGYFALQKIEKNPPDIVLLDIEMPQMDGIEFLERVKELEIDIPVVVLSSLGRNRPEITLRSLELGAKDFIVKPSGTISLDIETVKEEVQAKIKYFYKEHVKEGKKPVSKDEVKEKIKEVKKPSYKPPREPDKIERPSVIVEEKEDEEVSGISIENKIEKMKSVELVAIGISTGGPNALREILPKFEEDFSAPIVIVQHMPPGFTTEFAKGLDEICKLKVKEAEDFDPVEEGVIYIAPGNRHVKLEKKGMGYILKLDDGPNECGHKPSAEVLFKSVSECCPKTSIAIIMTGMGKDGSKALRGIRVKGGITFAQSEDTCVVFGMPKVAIEHKSVDEIIDLKSIPSRIIEIVNQINGS